MERNRREIEVREFATVREALHTLTAISLKEDVDDAEIHENSLNAYAALDRLEQDFWRPTGECPETCG